MIREKIQTCVAVTPVMPTLEKAGYLWIHKLARATQWYISQKVGVGGGRKKEDKGRKKKERRQRKKEGERKSVCQSVSLMDNELTDLNFLMATVIVQQNATWWPIFAIHSVLVPFTTIFNYCFGS